MCVCICDCVCAHPLRRTPLLLTRAWRHPDVASASGKSTNDIGLPPNDPAGCCLHILGVVGPFPPPPIETLDGASNVNANCSDRLFRFELLLSDSAVSSLGGPGFEPPSVREKDMPQLPLPGGVDLQVDWLMVCDVSRRLLSVGLWQTSVISSQRQRLVVRSSARKPAALAD